LQLPRIDRLVFAQFLRDAVERGAMRCHQFNSARVRGAYDALYLFIDQFRRRFAIV